MPNQPQQPGPLSKADLFKRLQKFNEKTVRQITNKVISTRREIPLKEAKCIKVLFASEVESILKEFT